MTYLMKTIAFTLAETLVVMGIIGVVAALTIPNLNQSTGDREKVAKVKKIYSNLEDAYGRATAVYGPIDEWFEGIDESDDQALNKKFAERMIEFMKISKNCEFGDGCFSENPFVHPEGDMDDNYLEIMKSDDYYMVMLADGSSLGLGNIQFNSDIFAKIRVDIDGPNKGKNQAGNDLFDFNIDGETKNLIPSFYPEVCTGDFTPVWISGYATAWVIQNGNMDYWKCDDLNWETKTSCK